MKRTVTRLTANVIAVLVASLCAFAAAFAAAPVNDHFADAEAITNATGSVTSTTANATRQMDETLANSSVWYRWTAPFTGAIRFDASAQNPNLVLAAYQGDSLPNLAALAQKSAGSSLETSIEFNVTDGHVYRIQVGEFDGLAATPGPFTLGWSRITGPGRFRFHSAFPTLSENAGTATFTVERVPANGPATVRYAFLDRTGKNGRDYIGTDDNLIFADRETTKSFTVQILDDTVVDAIASFVVKLSDPTGGSTLAFPSFANVVIEDDDFPPNDLFASAAALAGGTGSINGSLAGATVEDGEPPASDGGSARATLWYSFTPATSGILTCRLSDRSSNGTQTNAGIAPIDVFTGATLPTLAPAPNTVRGTDGAMVIPVIAGTGYLVRLDDPNSRRNDFALNYTLGAGTSIFEIGNVGSLNEIRENGGTRIVTVNRLGALDTPASVRIRAFGRGAAVSDADFVALDTVLNFAPDESSQTVTLTALADTVLEGNERVRLKLSDPTGSAQISPDSGESIIINDQQDDPPNDDFATAPALAAETTQIDSTNVGASRETGEPVHLFPRNRSVWFNYTAPKDGITTISAHNQKFSALLAVYTGVTVDALSRIGDDTDDSDDGPAVVRFPATGGTIYRIAVDDRDDRGRLFDDSEDSDDRDDGQGGGGAPFLLTFDTIAPGTLGFSRANYVVSEAGGDTVITIVRASGTDGQVSVRYATTDGTAQAGRDYAATAGEAVFAPGQDTATISIPILDNATFDGPRTVQLDLSDPGGDAALGLTTATLVIEDEDEFAPGKGTYTALVSPGSFDHSGTGLLKLDTNPRGKFSGTLRLGGDNFRFRGSFDQNGASTVGITRNGVSLIMTIHVTDHRIFGTVTSGNIVSTIDGAKNPFSKKGAPAPQAGTFTVLFPGDDENPGNGFPKGDGFATLKITASGNGKLVGTLADGTKISIGTSLSLDGVAPVHAALYRKTGSISGKLTFRSVEDMSDADGTLHVFKPGGVSRTKFYPAGYSIDVPVLASRYVKPKNRRVLDGLDANAGDAVLAFGEGNLPTELNQTVNVDIQSSVRVTEPIAVNLKAKIKTKNGLLSGSFVPLLGTRTKFKGVIFQAQNRAGGYFLGSSESGYVRLIPAPTAP